MLCSIRTRWIWLRHVYANGGYAGSKLRSALRGAGGWMNDVVKWSEGAKRFEVTPSRW